MTNTRTKPRRRGFTILEICVACLIVTGLFVILAATLRQTRLFSQRIEGRGTTQEDALLCMKALVNELAEATAIVAPTCNDDGSPRTRRYLVYRNACAEVVFLALNEDTGEVVKQTGRWRDDGSGFQPLFTEVCSSSAAYRELSFTVVRGKRGHSVRLALRTDRDWFFEGVTPWLAHH